jgi:hypothetical protein
MKNILVYTLLCSLFSYGISNNAYSTTSVVTMVAAVLRSEHQKDNIDKKYKRKYCPVCKGKGWYMSGDGIEKINCQYCEP